MMTPPELEKKQQQQYGYNNGRDGDNKETKTSKAQERGRDLQSLSKIHQVDRQGESNQGEEDRKHQPLSLPCTGNN